jgi:protein phosphatase 1G
MGRVNGTLNLSRAIGMHLLLGFFQYLAPYMMSYIHKYFLGDMEFKQNKFLSPDKQILTANPDINIVSEFCSCFTLQLITVCYVGYCVVLPFHSRY